MTIPKIEEVVPLPDLFLSIKFTDESVKFVRSQLNIDEMNAFKNGSKKLSDLLRLLAGYNWIGCEINIADDNAFSVNGVEYGSKDIYINGKNSFAI